MYVVLEHAFRQREGDEMRNYLGMPSEFFSPFTLHPFLPTRFRIDSCNLPGQVLRAAPEWG